MAHEEHIKTAFAEIEHAVRALIAELLRCEISECTVFQYPRVNKDAEHDEYTYIPVTRLTGKTAEAKAIAAYGQFRGEGSASTKAVFRLPGVIAVETVAEDVLIALLSRVNCAKDHFHAVAKSIPEDQRFEVIHDAFPRLIYLQVVRHLNWYTGPLQAVNFTWGSSSSITTVRRDDIVERLATLLDQNKISYDQAIDDTQRLQSLSPDVQLRQKRIVKVRPLINLNRGKGVSERYKRKEGHLPLIVINSGGFKTGVLSDFTAEKKRKTRSDIKTDETPLLQSLPVYRVKLNCAG